MFASAIVTCCLALSLGEVATAAEVAAPPAHRVVATYFHRTVRCPTCRRIGGLAEEAVKRGFAEEISARTVEFRLVDFQDPHNAGLTQTYSVVSPTLVVTNEFDGKVVHWKALPRVWQLVGKPDELRGYVRESVAAYLQQTRSTAQQDGKEAQP